MDTREHVGGLAAAEPKKPEEAAPARRAGTPAAAYLLDPDSEGVVRRCFADLGLVDGQIVPGGIDAAIAELPQRGSPHFLIVDIGSAADPLPQINRLAEVCQPETEVVVVGDRNDIVLYRELKAAGVAEYFYKPLFETLLTRVFVEIGSGRRNLQPTRSGKLVSVLGVRGGVGATTVATNLAWYFAEVRQRGVLLLDLDLQAGDAALQLDAKPSHALREALDDPRRIDELFLERGVAAVTDRLSLLAALEPLTDRVAPDEEAVLQLLRPVLARFRYVVIDLPPAVTPSFPALLQLPSTVVLVSDASLSAIREVQRWREFLGVNTPDRTLLHVLNKRDADGALPESEMLRIIPPPDVSIRWEREIMRAAALGTKALQECGAIRDGMAQLCRLLSGAAAEEGQSLWHRIFG